MKTKYGQIFRYLLNLKPIKCILFYILFTYDTLNCFCFKEKLLLFYRFCNSFVITYYVFVKLIFYSYSVVKTKNTEHKVLFLYGNLFINDSFTKKKNYFF